MLDRDRDELVGVAHVGNRAEAEMIQGLLDSAGIPSALQQTGVDGPQLGIGWLNPGGGSRRILVRADRAEEARALLAQIQTGAEQEDWTEADDPLHPEATGRGPRNYGLVGAYARIWGVSLGVVALAFAIFLLLRSAGGS